MGDTHKKKKRKGYLVPDTNSSFPESLTDSEFQVENGDALNRQHDQVREQKSTWGQKEKKN